MTTKLVEDGIAACSTWALVTKFLAAMFRIAAFQRATTAASAYMFCFKVLKGPTRRGVQRSGLATIRLSLGGLLLTSTATFATLVSATV
jgi:hypothetical protein